MASSPPVRCDVCGAAMLDLHCKTPLPAVAVTRETAPIPRASSRGARPFFNVPTGRLSIETPPVVPEQLMRMGRKRLALPAIALAVVVQLSCGDIRARA